MDCEIGSWDAWGTCTKSCGSGTQSRQRTVQQPHYGGVACPTVNAQTQACATQVCPTPTPTKVPTANPTNVPYPIINVIGGDEITVEATTDLQQSYDDEGATCYDNHDQDLTQNVVVMGDIVNLIDAFGACRHIQYECTNTAGLTSSKIRTVCVNDSNCPTCQMNNPTVTTVTVEASFPYVDSEASCSDTFDGAKTLNKLYSNGPVDVEATGTYVITYTATDDSGNSCSSNEQKSPRRTVVVMDTLKPVIGLQYGSKFIHTTASNGQTQDSSAYATRGAGLGQDNDPTTNTAQPNPAYGGGNVIDFPQGSQPSSTARASGTSQHPSSTNYFSLMAEAASSSSAFVLGAIVSAISGVALVSYAAQQKSTSAVADLV